MNLTIKTIFLVVCHIIFMTIICSAEDQFVIKDEKFQAQVKEECKADIEFQMKDGKLVARARGVLLIRDGEFVIWCYGAEHKWIGVITYEGYVFDSDKENPLQFRVDKDKGYVYVGGRGTVTTPDGVVVKLPLAKSKKESDVIKTEIKLTKNPDFGRVPGASKFRMEVLKGSIKEKSGAVFKEGSSLYIDEDEIIYETGMTIIAGKGGIELKGKFYPEGTKIKVGGKGELIRVKKGKK